MTLNMLFATKQRKIVTITAGIFFCLFLLYVVVGFFIIAPVAKWQIEKQLPPVIHRKVAIEKIWLNPLTLRVELKNLIIRKKDDTGDLFSVETLEAQLSGKSILALAPIVTHVRIAKPEINLTRYKDNTLSIDDLLQEKSTQKKELPEENGTKKDTRIFPFKVLNLILEDGTIVFNDEVQDTVQTISKLSLAVPLTSSFTSHLDDAVTPELKMLINGKPFDLAGSTFPFSNNLLTKFSFRIKNLSLARYWRYVPVNSPVALTSGLMNATINIGFSRPPKKAIQLHVDGKLDLSNVRLTKSDSSAVLDVPHMQINLKNYSLAEKKLVIQNIEIDSPYVEVHRQKDGSINWATFFTPQASEDKSTTVAKSDTTEETTTRKDDTASEKEHAPKVAISSKTQKAATPSPEKRPFVVAVESLTVKKGNVLFKDSTIADPFSITLTPLDIQVTNFSTEPKSTTSFALSAGDNNMIEAKGNLVLLPLSASLSATLQDLPIAQFTPYLATATPAKLGKGTLSAAATIEIAPNTNTDTTVRIIDGMVRVDNLAVTGAHYKKAPVSLQTLIVDDANIDLENHFVSIGKIDVIAPNATITRSKDGIDLVSLFVTESPETSSTKSNTSSSKDKSTDSSWSLHVGAIGMQSGKVIFNDKVSKKRIITNLKDVAITAGNARASSKSSGLSVSSGKHGKSTVKAGDTLNTAQKTENLVEQLQAMPAALKATTSPLNLSIEDIALQDGAITFKDASISPEVVLALDNIAASYKQFTLTGKAASPVEFIATLNGRAISASGTANPMASPLALDLTVHLDNISLRNFSPYTVKHIAYPVETGSLNANVVLKAHQNKLDAQNKLLFEDFTLGSRDDNSNAPAVPIKLGLSLMRQPNGNISLSLPITGKLDDPDFHLSQIIVGTLVNVIVKAAISPFTILGSLIGDLSAEEAQFVIFAPGSAELPAKNLEILTKMAAVLKDKQSITIESLGHYSMTEDAQGLRNRALKKAVTEQWYNDLSNAEQEKIDIAAANVPEAVYEKYLKAAYETVPKLENDPRPTKLLGYEEQPREKMEEFLKNLTDTSHEALRKLAQDRANAVREAITQNTPELLERVTALQAGPSEGDTPATAVQLMLK